MHPSELPTCVYCGHAANALDHVLPRSRLHELNPELSKLLFTVSCCDRCNGSLNNKLFPTFSRRAEYILRRFPGDIKWTELNKSAPIVQSYLSQLDAGKSTVQLDAELGLTKKRSQGSYFSKPLPRPHPNTKHLKEQLELWKLNNRTRGGDYDNLLVALEDELCKNAVLLHRSNAKKRS